MNTSYSSMARKGLSVLSPRARIKATVVKDRSPPEEHQEAEHMWRMSDPGRMQLPAGSPASQTLGSQMGGQRLCLGDSCIPVCASYAVMGLGANAGADGLCGRS